MGSRANGGSIPRGPDRASYELCSLANPRGFYVLAPWLTSSSATAPLSMATCEHRRSLLTHTPAPSARESVWLLPPRLFIAPERTGAKGSPFPTLRAAPTPNSGLCPGANPPPRVLGVFLRRPPRSAKPITDSGRSSNCAPSVLRAEPPSWAMSPSRTARSWPSARGPAPLDSQRKT